MGNQSTRHCDDTQKVCSHCQKEHNFEWMRANEKSKADFPNIPHLVLGGADITGSLHILKEKIDEMNERIDAIEKSEN